MLYLKLLSIIFFPVLLRIVPHPEGVAAPTWYMVGIYLVIFCGLVLRPFTDAVTTLTIPGFASLTLDPGPLFARSGSLIVWFIISAFIICRVFVITELGKRITYLLLKRYGKNILTLNYLMMVIDTVLTPTIGSNVSRSGGITYPTFRNIAETLGSKPDDGSRKIDAYLTVLICIVSMGTSNLPPTRMVTNSITVPLANEIMKVNLEWMTWFEATVVPAGLMLILAPWILYKICTPELKVIENVNEATEGGLNELSPVKRKEKLLIMFFILGVLGWMIGSITSVVFIPVGLAFFACLLLFGILSWNDVVSEKSAWQTFVWYDASHGCAVALLEGGFYVYLVDVIKNCLDLSHLSGVSAVVVLVSINFAVRYFFASNSAFVVSFYPVLSTPGVTTQVHPMYVAPPLASPAGYGALLIHYGNGVGVFTFSSGYVSQKASWMLSITVVVMNVLILLLISIPYWKFIGI